MAKKIIILLLIVVVVFPSGVMAGEITIYSGRSENLIGPVFESFEEETGIDVNVRYGGTAELAATIMEEGRNSPADVFFAQDAGALGALAEANRLQEIPEKFLNKIDPRLKAENDLWIGISGRARVISYNINNVNENKLPDTIWGFIDDKWEGRLGWAPTNGSFQTFVTALRIIEGEERAAEWLRGILDNNPRNYPNNTTTVDAVGRGEVDIGFVNHYYLFRFIAERGEDFPARNYYTDGDAGSMINIAGTGILDVTDNKDEIYELIEYLLSEAIQEYFVEANSEYPVITEIEIDNPLIRPLEEIETPDIDLSKLEDLGGTLKLLREVGAL